MRYSCKEVQQLLNASQKYTSTVSPGKRRRLHQTETAGGTQAAGLQWCLLALGRGGGCHSPHRLPGESCGCLRPSLEAGRKCRVPHKEMTCMGLHEQAPVGLPLPLYTWVFKPCRCTERWKRPCFCNVHVSICLQVKVKMTDECKLKF